MSDTKRTGAQADVSVVSELHNRLAALVAEAEAKGVVLEIRLEPKQPLAMSHYRMATEARAAWVNG